MTALALFLYYLAQILTFAILGRAILSWFPVNPRNPLLVLIYQITEPVLAPLRRIVPRVGLFDITPIVAILLLQFLAQLFARMA